MLRKSIIAALFTLGTFSAQAAELGDDGLHQADWINETFLDLREDLDEANAEGKRLMVIIEQRGCIYCTQMHEDIYPIPEIHTMLSDDYFVVRLNLYGDLEVVDFDGNVLSEKQMARNWAVNFTPTMMFFPQEVDEGLSGRDAAVMIMPGAFGRGTTLDMLTWVLNEGYAGDEDFQRYHARMIQERGVEQGTD